VVASSAWVSPDKTQLYYEKLEERPPQPPIVSIVSIDLATGTRTTHLVRDGDDYVVSMSNKNGGYPCILYTDYDHTTDTAISKLFDMNTNRPVGAYSADTSWIFDAGYSGFGSDRKLYFAGPKSVSATIPLSQNIEWTVQLPIYDRIRFINWPAFAFSPDGQFAHHFCYTNDNFTEALVYVIDLVERKIIDSYKVFDTDRRPLGNTDIQIQGQWDSRWEN